MAPKCWGWSRAGKDDPDAAEMPEMSVLLKMTAGRRRRPSAVEEVPDLQPGAGAHTRGWACRWQGVMAGMAVVVVMAITQERGRLRRLVARASCTSPMVPVIVLHTWTSESTCFVTMRRLAAQDAAIHRVHRSTQPAGITFADLAKRAAGVHKLKSFFKLSLYACILDDHSGARGIFGLVTTPTCRHICRGQPPKASPSTALQYHINRSSKSTTPQHQHPSVPCNPPCTNITSGAFPCGIK